MSANKINESILINLRKAKNLKKNKKYSQALSLLEDLQKFSKKYCPALIPKISPKIVSLANKMYKTTSLQSLLHQSDSAIHTYLQIHPKTQVPEKHFIQFLQTFNTLAGIFRRSKNNSQALSYFFKVQTLGIKPGKGENSTFEPLAKLSLNIASYMAELGNYKDSIKYAKESLKILQMKTKTKPNNNEGKVEFSETISTYTLAFLTIANAQEALGNKLLMKEALDKALEVSKDHLFSDNSVLMELINKSQQVQSASGQKIGVVKSKITDKPNKDLKTFHLDLLQPTSSVKFNEKKHQVISQTEPKVPGRYYTKSQLKAKEKLINSNEKLNFISADQYFFNEVSKVINISNDSLQLHPTYSSEKRALIRQENSEKRIISDLRLKKHYRHNSVSPISDLFDKIKVLKNSEKEELKKISQKMRNIFSSTQSKDLVKKLCQRGKRKVFPNQRLLFKAPLSRTESTRQTLKVNFGKQTSIFQHAKDEIEELMGNINSEIQQMYTQGSSKGLSPSYSGLSYTEGSLVRSTYKSTNSPEKSIKIIKKSIKSSLKPLKIKKHDMHHYSVD